LVNYHVFWFGDVNVICNRTTKTYSVACIKQTSVEKICQYWAQCCLFVWPVCRCTWKAKVWLSK